MAGRFLFLSVPTKRFKLSFPQRWKSVGFLPAWARFLSVFSPNTCQNFAGCAAVPLCLCAAHRLLVYDIQQTESTCALRWDQKCRNQVLSWNIFIFYATSGIECVTVVRAFQSFSSFASRTALREKLLRNFITDYCFYLFGLTGYSIGFAAGALSEIKLLFSTIIGEQFSRGIFFAIAGLSDSLARPCLLEILVLFSLRGRELFASRKPSSYWQKKDREWFVGVFICFREKKKLCSSLVLGRISYHIRRASAILSGFGKITQEKPSSPPIQGWLWESWETENPILNPRWRRRYRRAGKSKYSQ